VVNPGTAGMRRLAVILGAKLDVNKAGTGGTWGECRDATVTC
jgi:hypothetical protein